MVQKKGDPKTPGSGRKKGSLNKTTREMKEFMESILFDDREVTHTRLIEMRDSDDSADRRIFWGIATKLIPNAVEGKIDTGLVKLVLDQNYLIGQTREIVEDSDEEMD